MGNSRCYLEPDQGKPWAVENRQLLTRIAEIAQIVGSNPSDHQYQCEKFISNNIIITRVLCCPKRSISKGKTIARDIGCPTNLQCMIICDIDYIINSSYETESTRITINLGLTSLLLWELQVQFATALKCFRHSLQNSENQL